MVERERLRNVPLAESDPLSDLGEFLPVGGQVLPRQDGIQVGALGEGVPGVVHDAVVVVLEAQGVDLLRGQPVEVVLLA